MVKKIAYLFIFFAPRIFAQNFIGCNKGLDNSVYGLYNDTVLNKLIVFGVFDHADGKLVRGMATWDGHNWDSLGGGEKKSMLGSRAMIIRYKNRLYAQFDDYYLHAYDYTTQQWQQIPGRIGGYVRDATILNDELYIVGDFDSVGVTKVRNIIKFNGTSYDTLPKRPLFSFYFLSIEAYKNELYVGGLFDPVPFQGVVKFDGSDWVSASPNLTMDGGPEVWDFQIYNGKLFMCGKWTNINGEYNPSCAAWDGQKWYNLGGMTFQNGITGALGTFKVYNNKLYVIGGFDYADTVKTADVAVWNDTIWCGVKMVNNTGLQNVPFENYKNQWYFCGSITMSGDTVPVTHAGQGDTINYLGIYVGNHGKLERDCFDKPTKEVPVIFGLYPNPTRDVVNFNLTDYFGEKCDLKIIDGIGQVIAEYQEISSNSKMNIETFASGMFIFMFSHDGTQKTYKVIKL